ncbi:MAG: tyrosine-type recombinase/integrase [Pyrinomonadaceae bacterium]
MLTDPTLSTPPGPQDFLFSNSRTGVNIDSIKTGWRSACEDAGLLNLRFHDTRHTFATRLRANGIHEWDIRDSLGHTSVRMTSVYTHQTPANLCHAVNTLTQTKLGKVVRFPRKKRDRSTKQIAPSSRHRERVIPVAGLPT